MAMGFWECAAMMEAWTILLLALLLGWPLGKYLSSLFKGESSPVDPLFNWLEKPLYRLLGVNPLRGMPWPAYMQAFLISNLVLAAWVWLIFVNQGWLPLNPDQVPSMSWDLALHTTVSFLTNTNQQHYSGQAQLSYLAQMTGIVGLQVVSPMMGLAVAVATLRALFRCPDQVGDTVPQVGNYWADVVRGSVRFMLPISLVLAVVLTSQGVPSTLAAGPLATPLDTSAGMAEQKIPLGPVAAMVAVKQLGTNGGGWYGPNSSVALENPTPFANLVEMLAIVLVPVAITFMVGAFTGRWRFGLFILASMLLMSLLSAGSALWLEQHSMGQAISLEGKEVRFGTDASALWAVLTTQTSNGSVNMMHDSASPLTGLVLLSNMLINAIWGGIGCGLQQFMLYLMLGVFLAGLMTGRTPELFGRKIEAPEIRWLAVLVLLQPLVILGFTAITLAVPTLTGNSNPSFHGITQVFYEYTSAFSNNGSGFEGLGDATPWWNLSCTLVLLLGRYPALLVPLVIAASLARKRRTTHNAGSLQIETPTFALTLIAVIVILTVLQFMPVLVLGPIAEHFSLASA